MTPDTTGFLAIWNDTDPARDADWVHWHTVEHFPERVGVDGFLVGRRYLRLEKSDTLYFTLYEGTSVNVFNGPAYLERLNNPTPWTQEISSAFRNFTRGACRLAATSGHGNGGYLCALRLVATDDNAACQVEVMAAKLAALSRLVGIHVGICDRDITLVKTVERERRTGTADDVFDVTILIEADRLQTLQGHRAAIREIIARSAPDHQVAGDCLYQLAYHLAKTDLRVAGAS